MTSAMLQAAQGLVPAELVFKNAAVLHVFTKELIYADVAVCGDTIVGVGKYQGLREIDCTGRFIVPGFIDAHLHIESSMLLPAAFAEEIAPLGTTTVIADPHEIANVAGLYGIRFLLEQSQALPCNFFFMLPSCVPATPFDDAGASLSAKELLRLKDDPAVLGLGEMMNAPGVLQADPGVLEKLDAFSDRVIDGHAPLLTGPALQAYLLAGIATDHECSQPEEVLEKLRGGMQLLAREGSAAKNLEAVVQTILENHLDFDRVSFCTDDRHVGDIRREGHIDNHIRKAIRLGVDPITAYLCATLHPAQAYGLKHLGAVAAGFQADFVILDSLLEVEIRAVYHRGNLVERAAPVHPDIPPALSETVCLAKRPPHLLRLPCGDGAYPVIEVIPHQINTHLLWEPLPHRDGWFVPSGGYCKAAVLERHKRLPGCGIGAVKGLSLHGAIAATVAHDSHNLIVLGGNDADMLAAIDRLEELQGGYAAVQNQTVLAEVPLPVAGLMSDRDGTVLEGQSEAFSRAVHAMGLPEQHDPFQTLSFLSLPVLPEARLTNRGIFDALHGRYLAFAPQAAEQE